MITICDFFVVAVIVFQDEHNHNTYTRTHTEIPRVHHIGIFNFHMGEFIF